MKPATRTTTTRLTLLLFAAAASVLLPCGCQKAPPAAGVTESSAGYTLIHQLMSRRTDLVDMEGRLVHRWRSKHGLAGGARMLANGDLVRTGLLENSPFNNPAPGITGVVERFDWDGNLLWSFVHAQARKTIHHDIEVLPNGNLLLIGVETKARDEVLAAGRDPARMREDSLWSDYIIEVSPSGDSGGRIVWEWHAWDHLVQDHDAGKRNHGVISGHPELIDINFIETPSPISGSRLKVLQSVGYVGGAKGPSAGPPQSPDWTHVNSVAYHAELDQILLSVRNLGEIWIIDHSASTAEAAGHSGGRYGRGGDLLYRWGNPQAYQRGKPSDQKLFGPHHGHWIPPGLPGAGNVLIFNNGEGRKGGEYSAIEEIRIPSGRDGSYKIDDGKPYGPDAPVWRYVADPKTAFYSSFLSGVQRLVNGNTLICSGMERKIFEVDPSGRTVWSHTVQTEGDPPPDDLMNAPRPPPPPGGGLAGLLGALVGGGTPPRPPLISILDINGDGFIDAAEVAEAPLSLKKLDRNGDDALSIDECLPRPGGGHGGPPGVPGGPPGGPGGALPAPPLPPIFTVLDSNSDGTIDAVEVAQATKALPKLDRNGDGRIGFDECLPEGRAFPVPPGGNGDNSSAPPGAPGGPPPLPPIITAFGPARDGTISAEAIARAPEILRKLDGNGDGRLTSDEYLPKMAGTPPPGGPGGRNPAPPMPPIALVLDANGDGVIDPDEIAGSLAALARLDRDGDGRISLSESLPGSPEGPQSPGLDPTESARRGGLFRAERFGMDHPAIKGRRLTPFGEPPPPPQPKR